MFYATSDDDFYNEEYEDSENAEIDDELRTGPSETMDLIYIEDEVKKPDYLGLARDHAARAPYSRNLATLKFDTEAIRCCLCSSDERPCTKVLFPCDHLCICDACINEHRIGPWRKTSAQGGLKSAWHACPLCMQEIVYMREYREGEELEEYWAYTTASSSNLPPGFRRRFKGAAKHLAKTTAQHGGDGNSCAIQ